MHYEVHITVNTRDTYKFKSDCERIGVKPIVIETETLKNGLLGIQVMTSSKHTGDDYKLKVRYISNTLKDFGYSILRKKVEIKPEPTKHIDFKYYETHVRLKLPLDFDYTWLREICDENKFHLSKNLFKETEDFKYQMCNN